MAHRIQFGGPLFLEHEQELAYQFYWGLPGREMRNILERAYIRTEKYGRAALIRLAHKYNLHVTFPPSFTYLMLADQDIVRALINRPPHGEEGYLERTGPLMKGKAVRDFPEWHGLTQETGLQWTDPRDIFWAWRDFTHQVDRFGRWGLPRKYARTVIQLMRHYAAGTPARKPYW